MAEAMVGKAPMALAGVAMRRMVLGGVIFGGLMLAADYGDPPSGCQALSVTILDSTF